MRIYGDDQSSSNRLACKTATLGGVLDVGEGVLEGLSPSFDASDGL